MKPTASTELLSQRTDPRCLALVPGFGAAIRRGIATLLMVAAICALTAVTARADTFTVNSVWDMVDYAPGDGVCDTDPDPLYVVCTLRAAVQEANAAGAGTIVLPAGTYYLYIAGSDEDAAATGDLDITSNLIIAGSDTDQSIISAYYNMNDRVLHIIGTVHPTISHVWIEGGRCDNCDGGGLYNPNGSPTIQNVTFESNSAIRGGGMYNGTGTPTISSSSFLTNSVTTDAGRGGGLYNESADLTIEGLTFQGNSAVGYFHSPTNWAAGFGGGLYNGSGTLVIRGNTFQGNWASGYHMQPPDPDQPNTFPGLGGQGGGVYNESGNLTFETNTFTGNTVSSITYGGGNGDPYYSSYSYGGGIHSESGNLEVRNNVFTGNNGSASNSAYGGGGAFSSITGTLTIQSNRFEHNVADWGGGGDVSALALTVEDNEFIGNSGDYGDCNGLVAHAISGLVEGNTFRDSWSGGGLCVGGNLVARNNTVRDNPGLGAGISASGNAIVEQNVVQNNGGVGISIRSGTPLVRDNTVRDNVGVGIILEGDSDDTATILRNTIEHNQGGGIVFISIGGSSILNNIIRNNTSTQDGAGINIHDGSPLVQANTIFSNTVACNGTGSARGGGIYVEGGSPTITGNVITRNTLIPCPGSDTTIRGGAGVYNSGGSPVITNNIIANNSVLGADGDVAGGGLYVYAGRPQVLHNVIVNNSLTGAADTDGGGIYLRNGQVYDWDTGSYITSDPVIRNNVIANNVVAGASGAGGGIFSETASDVPVLDYNNVWNNTGGDYAGLAPGAHDISADPLFVDAPGGDYHLASGSPCIDTGDYAHRAPDDFDGDPRPMGLAPDIGADEMRAFGISKTGPTLALPGDVLTYTIRVVNLASGTAAGVRITDTLPAQVTLLSSQAQGLSCAHDGAPWGGALHCTTLPADMAPNASHLLTLTVQAANVLSPVDITNFITATANAGSLLALDRATTAISWCQVRVNEGPISSDLQAAIDPLWQESDVVKVSGRCLVHDINMDYRSLTLQGGWSRDFTARDPSVYVTTLDAQRQGRVLAINNSYLPDTLPPVIEGFTFTGGIASDGGAGIRIQYGNPIIRDNIFRDNLVSGSTVSGGAIYATNSNPVIQNNRFMNNQVTATGSGGSGGTASGGAIYATDGFPVIQDNRFMNNLATAAGSGLYNINSARGGAIYAGAGSPTIVNNGFYGNLTSAVQADGGAIHNDSSAALILNNTIISNTAQNIPWPPYPNASDGRGGGIYDATADATIRNNIVVSNTAKYSGSIYRLHTGASAAVSADFNDVWGNAGGDYYPNAGQHDISADPKLAAPQAGDFHLLAGSPCLDKGDPNQSAETDFEGDFRPMGLAPEIGMDEVRGLGVRKTGPVTVAPGETFTYTLRLANLTGSVATGVVVTDDLPGFVALTGQQGAGLTCTHDGAAWGSALRCTPGGGSLAPGATVAVTLTVAATDTIPFPMPMINVADVTADGGLVARGQAQSQLTWCLARLNDGPAGSDIQAAIDASTSSADVVRVSGSCVANNLSLDRILTLQGGWNRTFTTRDATGYRTTLDATGQSAAMILSSDPTVEGFTVTGGQIAIASGNPILRNNVIQNASSGSMGVAINSGNATIENNTFRPAFGPYGPPPDAGAISVWGGAPVIQRNVFQFIRSYSAGGVVVITSGAPILQNNLFHDNSAPWSGGGGVIAVKSYGGTVGGAIRYNTFTLNMGNAIAIGAQGTPDIRGNIISSNVNGSGIYNNGGLPTVDYNDVWGNTTNYTGVTPGSHDISANPRFANVNARNFRLGGDSPCIDAADPASFPPTDFEGDARPQSAAPDIGADEALIAAIHVAPDGAATLPLPNAQGQIAFPAGLVTTSTIFTYTEMLTPAQATGGFAFAGQSFTLVATDAAGQPVTSFTGHYTLTLNYSDADWQAAGIPAEENLNLYYWNGSAWVGILPCAGCALDTVNNRITAVLDHLTEFALLGSPLAAPAVTTSKATGGVELRWTQTQAGIVRYEVYRGSSPYVAPASGQKLSPDLAPPGEGAQATFTDTTAFDLPLTNYYYVVVAIGAGEAKSPMSNRAGVFHFTLTPGGQ